jgi:hypothetical protein
MVNEISLMAVIGKFMTLIVNVTGGLCNRPARHIDLYFSQLFEALFLESHNERVCA